MWRSEIATEQRDIPFGNAVEPVVLDAPSPGVVHCAIVNLFPCRVETTFKISSGDRVAILQEQFCGRGKLAVK